MKGEKTEIVLILNRVCHLFGLYRHSLVIRKTKTRFSVDLEAAFVPGTSLDSASQRVSAASLRPYLHTSIATAY